MSLPRTIAEVLSTDECLRLLQGANTGRVALNVRALPTVVPVDFILTGGGILLNTAVDGWVHAALNDAIVAFEADDVDPLDGSRWSVVVIGHAAESPELEPDERARVRGRRLWTDPAESGLVRISLDVVSGSRAVPTGARGC